MYAVVEIGGKQYKVSEGDTIDAERLSNKEGGNITLSKVLLFAKGQDIRVGQPYLKDVKVTAKVEAHVAGRKVLAFHFRRRKDSSKKIGHRIKHTRLNITKIAVE